MQFDVDHSGDMKAILDFLGLKNNTMKKTSYLCQFLHIPTHDTLN